MSKRLHKAKSDSLAVSDGRTELPTDHPVAVYYRQSTEAQVGNVSTTIQTVDMVAYLKQRGWAESRVIMIDMDHGVSGTKKIDDAKGCGCCLN